MKYSVVVLILVLFSCKNEPNKPAEITTDKVDISHQKEAIKDLELKVYDYDGLEPLINKTDDKIHVVNFWATWCAPCIKELPYFEMVNEKYNSENVEVLLVSLDFPKNYETKLKPYIIEKHLKSKVVAFDDVDQNRWIPAISEDWSGAIPATIIYNKDKRQFYEKSFTQEELETELKQFLK